MRPLFAIDVGNSTTGIALYGDCTEDRIDRMLSLPTSILKDRNVEYLLDEFYRACGDFIDGQKKKAHAVVSSVVPALDITIAEACKKLKIQRPLFVNHRNNRVLRFKTNALRTIGADRIATTAGAYLLYGGPVAVVDFGTATTISIADKDGVFLGGAIMPGLRLMLEGLRYNTAQLPLVDFQGISTALGTDTVSAILSGVVIGTAGAVERIIGDIEKAVPFRLQLVLTGGHAELVRPHLKRHHKIDPNLIYEGLRQIYLRQNI